MSDKLTELKHAFAAAWLKEPKDPFKAALEVFGMDTGSALRASNEWITDSEVIAEKKRLVENADNGDLDFLPSKAEAARLAWDLAQSSPFTEDKLKALKLYSDIRGFIAKPDTGVNLNLSANKVMVVKDTGTNDEWEAKLKSQQEKLISEASGNADTKH